MSFNALALVCYAMQLPNKVWMYLLWKNLYWIWGHRILRKSSELQLLGEHVLLGFMYAFKPKHKHFSNLSGSRFKMLIEVVDKMVHSGQSTCVASTRTWVWSLKKKCMWKKPRSGGWASFGAVACMTTSKIIFLSCTLREKCRKLYS